MTTLMVDGSQVRGVMKEYCEIRGITLLTEEEFQRVGPGRRSRFEICQRSPHDLSGIGMPPPLVSENILLCIRNSINQRFQIPVESSLYYNFKTCYEDDPFVLHYSLELHEYY